jgi:hypothetical protein
MDFLERLKADMEALTFTPSTVEIGMYNEDGNSVSIRPAPSNIDVRDMAQGKIYPFSFQVLSHHKNNLTAYQLLQDLVSEYDDVKKIITSSDNSFVMLSVKCTTTPNYVESTSYGALWTAIFEAELYIN